ncbi:MAG: class I SAM-dependent methyltransferase [Ardenticatenales bacterium]
MSTETTVILVRDVRAHISEGHPWLWAESLQLRTDIATGTTVDIVSPDGQFLGRGLWDARSPLAVRLWTRTAGEAIDAALVHSRVEAACARRRRDVPLDRTDCLRLVHGEADHMPGLIADRYADVAVVQADTPAVHHLLPAFADALCTAVPALHHVIYKPQRRQQGDEASVRALRGELPIGPVRVMENGLRFDVDIVRGHKTGAYLDQRDNRRRIGAMARGQRVLNLYSYTGWFSVAAAAGGAAAVTSVDVAAGAIEAARRNLAINGFDPRSDALPCVVDDVQHWLEIHPEPWDIIILDPPSMATSAAASDRAAAAYRHLNALAMSRTKAGGTLLTSSCSSHIDERTFMRIVDDAARRRGARVRFVGRYGAGPDHPTPRWFPEARYLTTLQVVVDDPGQTRQDWPARRPHEQRADGRPPRPGDRGPSAPAAPPKGRPSGPPRQRPGSPYPSAPRPDRPGQSDRPDRPSRPGRTDRPGRPNQPDRPSRPGRTDGPGRPSQPGRPPRPGGSDRPAPTGPARRPRRDGDGGAPRQPDRQPGRPNGGGGAGRRP